jgi:hypothetical protein
MEIFERQKSLMAKEWEWAFATWLGVQKRKSWKKNTELHGEAPLQ